MATNVSRSLVGSEWRLTVAESPFPVGTVGQWTGLKDVGNGGWSGNRLTQEVVQLLIAQSAQTLRLTQEAIQIMNFNVPALRVTQVAVQILLGRSEQPRISLSS